MLESGHKTCQPVALAGSDSARTNIGILLNGPRDFLGTTSSIEWWLLISMGKKNTHELKLTNATMVESQEASILTLNILIERSIEVKIGYEVLELDIGWILG